MSSYFSLLRQHLLKLSWIYLAGGFTVRLLSFLVLILWVGGVILFGKTPNLADYSSNSIEMLFAQGILFAIIVIVSLFVLIFFYIGVETYTLGGIYGAIKETLAGEKARFGTFFSVGWRYCWKMIWQIFLLFILLAFSLSLPVGLIIVCVATESTLGVLLAIFIGLATLGWIFLYMLVLIHGPVVMVYEEMGIFRSIFYTFRVIRKAFWDALLSLLSLILISIVGSVVLLIPFMIANVFMALAIGTGSESVIMAILGFLLFGLMVLFFIFVLVIISVASHLCLMYRYAKFLRPKAI